MAQAGGAVFGNMALIFAIGVALDFTNNDGVAALAATVGCAILTKTMTVKRLRSLMVLINPAPDLQLLRPTCLIRAFWVVSLQTIAAYMFNRFYRIQLPEYLGFFAI